MHNLEFRAWQHCPAFVSIHWFSLGGCSEHRFEFSSYRHCLYSCLQIIMTLLTFEWQCIWIWVCKWHHNLSRDISGQLQDLVLSTLSEDGFSVCHCLQQVHWHELLEDYIHVLQKLSFWGLWASNHRFSCLYSKHFMTELALQPTDYFISTNRSLIIYHMEILSPKTTGYCCGFSGDCRWWTVSIPHAKIQPH